MATNQANIKLSDLSEFQLESLNTFYPVVKKLFLVEPDGNRKPVQTADEVFKADVVTFLCTMETIFGEGLPKSITSVEKSKEEFIVESSLVCCRLSYRNWFSESLYLTVKMLDDFHDVAREVAVLNIQENASMFSLTDEEINVLKETILANLYAEIKWIDEVNSFKKNKIISEIKENVRENVKKLFYEEFSNLVREPRCEFYSLVIFRQKAMRLMDFALKSFQEQIPYREDESAEIKICKEFDDQVVKIVGDLRNKNILTNQYPRRFMATKGDNSVEKYTNAFAKILKAEPMPEACDIRMQHETLQELHMPVFGMSDPRLDDWKSAYQQRYFDETERIFQNRIREHSQNTVKYLNQSYQELFEVFNQFFGKEVARIFEKRQIPIVHIQRIWQTFNEQLEIVVSEIADSTISNPEVVKNVASWGKPNSSKKPSGTKYRNGVETQYDDERTLGGPLINVKICLRNGRTYKLEVFNMWTIKKVRQQFMSRMGIENKEWSLYHKREKLQDEKTLQSNSIQDGHTLFADI